MNASRSVRAVLLVLIIPLSTGAAHAAGELPPFSGPARLVKDINPNADLFDSGSDPFGFTRLDGVTLFCAESMGPRTGAQLWTSDGTAAGTALVKEMLHGFGCEYIEIGPELDGTVFMLIAIHGTELWKTDGSRDGTILVKELDPAGGYVTTQPLVIGGRTLFLISNDSVHGPRLWKSDGTEAGTLVVKTLPPPANGAPMPRDQSRPVWFEGNVYFIADDGIHGMELWKSDGTETGTVLVRDINAGFSGSYLTYLTVFGGVLYFDACDGYGGYGCELWATDGTEMGTHLVKDIQPGGDSGPTFLTEAGGILYFTAWDATHSTALWKTDGTAAGTILVKDVSPGPDNYSYQQLTPMSGLLYFIAGDVPHGTELWRSDGTEAGTVLVKDIRPGPGSAFTWSLNVTPQPRLLVPIDGMLYMQADDGVHGMELWASDGTTAGTALVSDIRPGPLGALTRSAGLIAANGSLFFGADEGRHGFEPWTSDGTARGTRLIRDINPENRTGSSDPAYLREAGGKVFFSADVPEEGRELWVSDGTSEGTHLVSDMTPGMGSSRLMPVGKAGGSLIFCDAPGFEGSVWRSGGTAASTALLPIGPCMSVITLQSGDSLFVSNFDGSHGETWKTDGTEAGTASFAGGKGEFHSAPILLGAFDGVLYFCGHHGIDGRGLWRTDGTDSGTRPLQDIVPGSVGSCPWFMAEAGGVIFFGGNDRIHGNELWRTDGTAQGTVLVKDTAPGRVDVNLYDVATLGHRLIFGVADYINGYSIWGSDGTTEGTSLLKAHAYGFLRPGSTGDTLFFGVYDGYYHQELWKTDGTTEGTALVRALPSSQGVSDLIIVDDTVIFFATDGVHGAELWRSDGTGAGTGLIQTFAPARNGDNAGYLELAGDRVFFTADDGFTGTELWAGRAAILAGQPARAMRELKEELLSLRLKHGTETSLVAKLDAADRALSAGRTDEAIVALENFIKHLGSESQRSISEASADDLSEFAGDLIALLEPSSPDSTRRGSAK